MTIDGRQIADEIYARLSARLAQRSAVLGIVCSEPNAVIESFVRIKSRAAERLGVALVRIDVPCGEGTPGVVAAIGRLVPETQGIIAQLPMPDTVDVEAVLAAIPGTHDVDGIGPSARVMPPVARAVEEILSHSSVELAGKSAVVIGAGRLVGAPVAKMVRDSGADVCVLQKGDSLDALKNADIIVSGAGEPGLIRPAMIREGVVLIDAGTSEQGGKVRGDADPACAGKCSVFTPVPGGVGPVAVAEIFENLAELAASRV